VKSIVIFTEIKRENFDSMLNKSKWIILLLCFISANHLKAQKSKLKDLRFQSEYQYGYILPEYSNLNYLIDAPVQAFNFSVIKQSIGKTEWEELYKYPQFGLSFFYTTLGNDEVHGREWAIYPFFRFNLIQYKRFSWFLQTGIGFGRVSKKFDLVDNYLNITTGSKNNIHYNLKSGFEFKISDLLRINAGVGLDHFSNGNTKEPNLGLNSLTSIIGFSIQPYKSSEKIKNEFSKHEVRNRPELSVRFGGKRARALASQYFNTATVSFAVHRNIYRAFHLGVGIDGFYDSSTETEMIAAKSGPYKSSNDFQTGISISQSIVYNKLRVIFQEGIYVGLAYKVKRHPIYTRGTVSYQITDPLAVSISMKSHLHVLDYPEIGINYRW
jgi:hypothetical protein